MGLEDIVRIVKRDCRLLEELDLKKDFNDKNFAEFYIKKHKKLLKKLGFAYAEKLRGLGFSDGKILDAGCGFGAMCLVLAEEFPDCEIVGVDFLCLY